MDPDQLYEGVLDALTSGDVEAASHRLHDLAVWVGRNGFLPRKLLPRPRPAREVARLLESAAEALAWVASDLSSKGEKE